MHTHTHTHTHTHLRTCIDRQTDQQIYQQTHTHASRYVRIDTCILLNVKTYHHSSNFGGHSFITKTSIYSQWLLLFSSLWNGNETEYSHNKIPPEWRPLTTFTLRYQDICKQYYHHLWMLMVLSCSTSWQSVDCQQHHPQPTTNKKNTTKKQAIIAPTYILSMHAYHNLHWVPKDGKFRGNNSRK